MVCFHHAMRYLWRQMHFVGIAGRSRAEIYYFDNAIHATEGRRSTRWVVPICKERRSIYGGIFACLTCRTLPSLLGPVSPIAFADRKWTYNRDSSKVSWR
jgi:hypothetical protein